MLAKKKRFTTLVQYHDRIVYFLLYFRRNIPLYLLTPASIYLQTNTIFKSNPRFSIHVPPTQAECDSKDQRNNTSRSSYAKKKIPQRECYLPYYQRHKRRTFKAAVSLCQLQTNIYLLQDQIYI